MPSSIAFCVTVWLGEKNTAEATASIEEETLRGMSHVGSAVRRLPLESETGHWMLKVRLERHGAVASDRPSAGLTSEERYQRLESVLAAAVNTAAPAPAPIAATGKNKPLPPLPRDSRATARMRRAITSQMGTKEMHRITTPVAGMITELLVAIGDPVFHRKAIAIIRVEEVEEAEKETSSDPEQGGLLYSSALSQNSSNPVSTLYNAGPGAGGASASLNAGGDAYAMPYGGGGGGGGGSVGPPPPSGGMLRRISLSGLGYSDDDEDKNKSLTDSSSVIEVPVKDESLVTIVWNDENPGVVRAVETRVGARVAVGATIVVGGVGSGEQQLAHLMQADKLGFVLSNTNQLSLNARFQGLAEKLVSLTGSGFHRETEATLECCGELERLARDFLDTARTYGRVIISELHLPVEAKTVRPLQLGGVLGGSKYVVRGVLFKIANGEMFSHYPDPFAIANKVQGHELKGLKAYFGWFFNRGSLSVVSFPLSAVIDYKGHRITAMSQLPIHGSKSLIYGADDAGSECTVRDTVPAWSTFIREASIGLGLKPHYVVNGRSKGGETEIASCVDLEGHKGSDQRFYLLDFSRTFPAAFRADERRAEYDQMWAFYHMLRPEFLASLGTPLSPDAFSSFQSPNRKEEARQNNLEIRTATEQLMTATVTQVATSLLAAEDKSLSLRHVFHRKGLNMRYLGLVYSRLMADDLYSRTRHDVYRSVQAEALMRVLKNNLRMQLRAAQRSVSCTDSRLQSEAASVLNSFFGAVPNVAAWTTKNAWATEQLVRDFYFNERQAKRAVETFVSETSALREVAANGQVSDSSIKMAVLTRLNVDVGLGLSASLLAELQKPPEAWPRQSFSRAVIFDEADFQFQERVKPLDVVERARGLAQFLKAAPCEGKDEQDKLLAAFESIEAALEASPLDPWLSLLMGEICKALWKSLTADSMQRERRMSEKDKQNPVALRQLADELTTCNLFSERAEAYYRQAVSGDQILAHRNLGLFLNEKGRPSEAEDAFLNALEACSRQGKTLDETALVELVALLEKRGETAMATSLRDKTKSWCHFRDNWLASSANVDLGASANRSFRMGGARTLHSSSSSPSLIPSSSPTNSLSSSQKSQTLHRGAVVQRAARQVKNAFSRKSPTTKAIKQGLSGLLHGSDQRASELRASDGRLSANARRRSEDSANKAKSLSASASGGSSVMEMGGEEDDEAAAQRDELMSSVSRNLTLLKMMGDDEQGEGEGEGGEEAE